LQLSWEAIFYDGVKRRTAGGAARSRFPGFRKI
jgi:hypothetical protein